MGKLLRVFGRPSAGLEDQIRTELRDGYRQEVNSIFIETLAEINKEAKRDSAIFLVTGIYKQLEELLTDAGKLLHSVRGFPLRPLAIDFIDSQLEEIELNIRIHDSYFSFHQFGVNGKMIVDDLYYGFTDNMVDFFSIALLAFSRGDGFLQESETGAHRKALIIFRKNVRLNKERIAAIKSYVESHKLRVKDVLESPEHMLRINERVYGSFERYKMEILETARYFSQFADEVSSKPVDIGKHIKNLEELAKSYHSTFKQHRIPPILGMLNKFKKESGQALSLFLGAYFMKYAERLEKRMDEFEAIKERRGYR